VLTGLNGTFVNFPKARPKFTDDDNMLILLHNINISEYGHCDKCLVISDDDDNSYKQSLSYCKFVAMTANCSETFKAHFSSVAKCFIFG